MGTTQTSPSFTSLNAWSPFNKGPSEEVVSVVDEPVDNELVPGPLGVKNGIAAAVWVSLVSWAFLFAPGALNSDADIALITKLISQPVPRPEDVNQIWFALWNFFAVVPAALAALSAPTGKGQRLNAVPFLWGSAFFRLLCTWSLFCYSYRKNWSSRKKRPWLVITEYF